MEKESLKIVSNDFVQRLSVLEINPTDKAELMLLITNFFQSVEEYDGNLKALQDAKQKRLRGVKYVGR